MRLLRHCDTGDFSLTKFGDEAIPPYAILSHTWGEDTTEVTFEDMTNSAGKDKLGYEKIQFCGEQARQHDLEYFWIDTCCIDKSNPAELQKAINSMFRWYRNATRCYVYLSDVSTMEQKTSDRWAGFTWESAFRPSRWFTTRKASDRLAECTWESAFRASRWFTRGWTLQELLAPASVEFFSHEGKRLGDKCFLQQQICEITGVPQSALQGVHLSKFSDKERFSWIECRQTKVEEDKAYSLLGIFDVEMPLRYSEGSASAFKRLEEEIDKLDKCLRDLRITNPYDDKKRIEDTKGGLLEDSYCWILDNADFQRWRRDQQSRLLRIKGDPGKGKTMLLCGIINELEKSMAKTSLLSYFFCQATDSRINNATAVLRGLIYMLVGQQPSLVSHIRKKHDHAGKALFEDANAWVALSEIFTDILQDPSLNRTYLIIDALDECVTDLPKLLDFVVQKSSLSSRAKWIVSSRNWPGIEERLERAGHKVMLSLELNAESVSTAVSIYIKHKVLQLAERKKYDKKTRDAVLAHLFANANGTFLWVAVVCENLEKILRWNILAKLNAFPPGLISLYERMMEQIRNSDDGDLCKRIMATIAVVYQPITLKELTSLVEVPEVMADDLELVREIIGLCGSFLTIQEGNIYFVHQSARDFLLTEAFNETFPSGKEEAHYAIFLRSLQVMSRTLRRDMYSLGALGYPTGRVKQPDPDLDPLAASRYSCIYWVDHLCGWNPNSSGNHGVDLQSGGAVDRFLREKYLYWLEALSLLRRMSDGVLAIAKLEDLLQRKAGASQLIDLVRDARRFIMYHKWVIENTPLQVYSSAILFSPVHSLTRELFQNEEPDWITTKPAMEADWGACLKTLEGHSHWVRSVAFSHDGTQVVSNIGITSWDISSDSNTALSTTALEEPRYHGCGLNADQTWIMWNSQNVLWLPAEYRPSSSAIAPRTIVIGCPSGRVLIINFLFNKSLK